MKYIKLRCPCAQEVLSSTHSLEYVLELHVSHSLCTLPASVFVTAYSVLHRCYLLGALPFCAACCLPC